MDLIKDNKNIYTVDSENYAEYMHDNWKKPRDILTTFIKLLLLILLFIVSYFFYNMLKEDLSFSEVFNKKELLSTYKLFYNDNEEKYVEKKENSVHILAKDISEKIEEPTKTALLSSTQKYTEPMLDDVVNRVNEVMLKEKVIVVEKKVVVLEKPKLVKIIEVVRKEKIVKQDVSEEIVFSENYLDLMAEALNSP